MNAEDLAAILDEIGRRLGPTGEYVFQLAVRQVYIYAIGWCAFAAVLFAFGQWTWRRADKAHDIDAPIVRVIGGVLMIGSVFLALANGLAVLNPEYAALRDLIGAVAP